MEEKLNKLKGTTLLPFFKQKIRTLLILFKRFFLKFKTININDVKYIINSTESNSLTYSQIKDANKIKVKNELDEFSKTLINSDRTHLILNRQELTNEVVVDGNYAIFY